MRDEREREREREFVFYSGNSSWNTAHARHFTDSVRMNLAAVLIRLKKKKKKKRGDSTESYCCVFNTFLPHFDMHIYHFFLMIKPTF